MKDVVTDLRGYECSGVVAGALLVGHEVERQLLRATAHDDFRVKRRGEALDRLGAACLGHVEAYAVRHVHVRRLFDPPDHERIWPDASMFVAERDVRRESEARRGDGECRQRREHTRHSTLLGLPLGSRSEEGLGAGWTE